MSRGSGPDRARPVKTLGQGPDAAQAVKSPGRKGTGRTGRPSKLDDDVTRRVVAAIRAGNYMETAAAHAGIDKQTLHRWLKAGRRGDPKFADFCLQVEKALAHAEVAAVAAITAAGRTQWQALAWRLERMHPTKWGRRDRVDHRTVDKDGDDAPVSGVLVMPAPLRGAEWDKVYGSKRSEDADGG